MKLNQEVRTRIPPECLWCAGRILELGFVQSLDSGTLMTYGQVLPHGPKRSFRMALLS